jgi:hypothetical protein
MLFNLYGLNVNIQHMKYNLDYRLNIKHMIHLVCNKNTIKMKYYVTYFVWPDMFETNIVL